jgi:hypothetical protein
MCTLILLCKDRDINNRVAKSLLHSDYFFDDFQGKVATFLNKAIAYFWCEVKDSYQEKNLSSIFSLLLSAS